MYQERQRAVFTRLFAYLNVSFDEYKGLFRNHNVSLLKIYVKQAFRETQNRNWCISSHFLWRTKSELRCQRSGIYIYINCVFWKSERCEGMYMNRYIPKQNWMYICRASARVYIYIYTWIYICICLCIYIPLNMYMHIYKCIYIYI